ncbi:MAG: dihydropteroate synthase [Verrucomicrobia bacterium RIFCSPHIGHO2_12_FULL_41_10]|nr:MAG: dihydropteroate synthase [Verrucomicrobia bacterium RIFCSPHIGHO2_12_FULL_41_10]HLB33909.1 dihydropteroate synthase [Chthoniobacterales bacterium]
MIFSFHDRTYDLDRHPLIAGILNVTPDSFSDGGNFLNPEKACEQGLKLLAKGADFLDIGGESTRPGSLSIETEEELRRVIPVIRALRKKTNTPLSIDTSKAAVAREAIAAGADIINDVTALQGDLLMGDLVANAGVGLILMHMQGIPLTMQQAPSYPNNDIVTAVTEFLFQAKERALGYGVVSNSIIIDPGLGFGKTLQHNLTLLRNLPYLAKLGSPIMIGHSRKSFLASIAPSTSQETTINNRLAPALAITTLTYSLGARLFRVHEPEPHKQALEISKLMTLH